MNIYAKNGDKVIVTKESVENGYDSDSKLVKSNLVINKIYEVERTEVSSFNTKVYIKGFPFAFNSVNFEDVEENNKED